MSRTVYTDAQKAEALAMYAEHGAAEAARRLGISPGTLASWASRAGVASVATPGIRAATEMSAARRTYVAEEFRTLMTEKLAEVATVAIEKELEVLRTQKPGLEKIVGARTRAIHDLQLLTGKATGRTETRTTDHLDREIERLLEAMAS